MSTLVALVHKIIARGFVRASCALALAGTLLTAKPHLAAAQSATLSAPLRAAIIKKVISYDKTLASNPVNVVIYYGQSTNSEAQELQVALDRAGVLSSTTASEDELKRRSSEIRVLYVLADDPPAGVRSFCRQARCLSLSSSMQAVEQGDASVAIGTLNGKPQLVVHMRRLGEERQDLSAEMLQLARVIR